MESFEKFQIIINPKSVQGNDTIFKETIVYEGLQYGGMCRNLLLFWLRV